MKSFKTYSFYYGFGTCGHCILASFLPLDQQKTWTWKLSPTLPPQITENHEIMPKMGPRRLPKSTLKSIKIDIWASVCLLGAPLGPRMTKMVSKGPKKGPQGHQNHRFSCKIWPNLAVNRSCWNFNCDGPEGPAAGGEALKIYIHIYIVITMNNEFYVRYTYR